MEYLKQRLQQANNIVKETEVMLQLQRKYFDKGRSYDDLKKSKLQERKVSYMIKSYNRTNQPNLFNPKQSK